MRSSTIMKGINVEYEDGDVFSRKKQFYTQIQTAPQPSVAHYNNQVASVQQPLLATAQPQPVHFNRPNTFQALNSSIVPVQTHFFPQSQHSTVQVNNMQYRTEPQQPHHVVFQSINRGDEPRQIQSVESVMRPSVVRISPQMQRALKEQESLNNELAVLALGREQFGNKPNEVAKLSSYALSANETLHIREQEEVIRKLEETVKQNKRRIDNYKLAAEQLNTHMGKIKTIDEEIYKNLKQVVNRDKELLDKAASALAKGESRENVAHILEQVIST